jgi:hypothetical protein
LKAEKAELEATVTLLEIENKKVHKELVRNLSVSNF